MALWTTGLMRAAIGAAAVGATLLLGSFFGYLRAALAVLMCLLIARFGIRFIRSMAIAPPEPEIADVSRYGLKYVCTMCGLELRVDKAARDQPPRHCMEPMELQREDGKPPLRPV
jgi:hypothetical protein